VLWQLLNNKIMYRYKKIVVDGKRIDEHRYVMQIFLNRKLQRNEVVHHVDNNPRNNSIINLELMSLSDHSKMHSTGKKLSIETIEKIKKNNVQVNKKVIMIDDGLEQKVFESQSEAARYLGVAYSTLQKAASNGYKCRNFTINIIN